MIEELKLCNALHHTATHCNTPHRTATQGSFRHDLVNKVIDISNANGYAAVTNFEWYIAILCRLAREPGVGCGERIKQQVCVCVCVCAREREIHGVVCVCVCVCECVCV